MASSTSDVANGQRRSTRNAGGGDERRKKGRGAGNARGNQVLGKRKRLTECRYGVGSRQRGVPEHCERYSHPDSEATAAKRRKTEDKADAGGKKKLVQSTLSFGSIESLNGNVSATMKDSNGQKEDARGRRRSARHSGKGKKAEKEIEADSGDEIVVEDDISDATVAMSANLLVVPTKEKEEGDEEEAESWPEAELDDVTTLNLDDGTDSLGASAFDDVPPSPVVPQEGLPSSYVDHWDDRHVKLPCSPRNTYRRRKDPTKRLSRWYLIQTTLSAAISDSTVRHSVSLVCK